VTETYEITFRGEPGLMTRDAFPEFELRCVPGVTVLQGEFVDHAALHGVIERIHSMALELISVRLIDDDEPRSAPSSSH
jgi:hypothetical protein